MNQVKVIIPVRCVSCNYPQNHGIIATAEVKCGKDEKVVQKTWRCPECGCETKFEFVRARYEDKVIAKKFPIYSPKKYEEMSPGKVEKMMED